MQDIVVGRPYKANEYNTHECEAEKPPSEADVLTASHVLRSLASSSSSLQQKEQLSTYHGC